MKNLSGSLIALTKPVEEEGENLKLVVSTYSGYEATEKHRRTSTNCCVCADSMWMRDTGVATWLIGTKVMDPRAYVGGLPDYLTVSNCLLEVHTECHAELKSRLNAGLYITNPNA